MQHEVTECHFNLTEAARYLGKSPRWLQYQLIGSNSPPAYKIGKSWLFKKSELDAWLGKFRVNLEQVSYPENLEREVARCN